MISPTGGSNQGSLNILFIIVYYYGCSATILCITKKDFAHRGPNFLFCCLWLFRAKPAKCNFLGRLKMVVVS